jgi:hypothetical protein
VLPAPASVEFTETSSPAGSQIRGRRGYGRLSGARARGADERRARRRTAPQDGDGALEADAHLQGVREVAVERASATSDRRERRAASSRSKRTRLSPTYARAPPGSGGVDGGAP